MDFELGFVQKQLQDSANRMLSDKLSSDRIREAEASTAGFPRAIWEECVQLGWPGLALPEVFGGGECSLLDLCVLAEALGRGGASLPLVTSSGLAATVLQHLPASEPRDQVLRSIANGHVVCAALIEAQGRNEWSDAQLPIDPDGKLDGKKLLVPYASAADAFLVTAVNTGGDIAIVLVDAAAQGVTVTQHATKIGTPLYAVDFAGVSVSSEQVLAHGDRAARALEAGLQVGSLLATAEAVGLCEALISMSAEYVTVRQAFGQSIGAFQAVAHPCADMRIHTNTVRLLVHEAAWLLDTGQQATEEIASTKALANQFFEKLANDAFRVHGAIGYSNEYDLQLFTRRLQGFCRMLGETQECIDRAARAAGIAA